MIATNQTTTPAAKTAASIAPVAPAQAKPSNVPSFDDLLKVAKDLGEQDGKGKDSQIKFLMAVVEGAYLGTLSLEKDKHGLGKDDATVLSEAYVRAKQGSVIFDVKADKTRKLCSTTRKGIKMGASPKWGRGQPMQFCQEFWEFWKKVRNSDPSALKKLPAGRSPKDLNDVFNASMRLFTKQLTLPTLLTDDERNLFAFKSPKEEKDVAEKLEAARKALRRSGDTSKETTDAINKITKRLADMAKGVK